jgi:low affinity Fe/Cu permease
MNELFRNFAHNVSVGVGKPMFFILALLLVLVWAVSGPWFGFSDTWQLVINTSTTIVTFLMVFLIQNTQNRDTKAINLKLDELIKAASGARNRLVSLESMTDEELQTLEAEFERLHRYHERLSEEHIKLAQRRQQIKAKAEAKQTSKK